MRNQEWDSILSQLYPPDLAQLVLGLLGRNSVHGEAALGVVHETKMLSSLFDADHVHKTSRVGRVCADFMVDFDQTLHEDGFGFTGIEGIFQTLGIMSCQSMWPVVIHWA